MKSCRLSLLFFLSLRVGIASEDNLIPSPNFETEHVHIASPGLLRTITHIAIQSATKPIQWVSWATTATVNKVCEWWYTNPNIKSFDYTNRADIIKIPYTDFSDYTRNPAVMVDLRGSNLETVSCEWVSGTGPLPPGMLHVAGDGFKDLWSLVREMGHSVTTIIPKHSVHLDLRNTPMVNNMPEWFNNKSRVTITLDEGALTVKSKYRYPEILDIGIGKTHLYTALYDFKALEPQSLSSIESLVLDYNVQTFMTDHPEFSQLVSQIARVIASKKPVFLNIAYSGCVLNKTFQTKIVIAEEESWTLSFEGENTPHNPTANALLEDVQKALNTLLVAKAESDF